MARETWPAMFMMVWSPARAWGSLVFSLPCPGPLSGGRGSADLGSTPEQDTGRRAVAATRHCLAPVLSRSAKTSFPGRGPLRCAPWSFPAWVSKIGFAGLRAANANVVPANPVGGVARRSWSVPPEAAARFGERRRVGLPSSGCAEYY